MPQRQYFYTPIVFENHNIGEQDGSGDYITSAACLPGAADPGSPMEIVSVLGEGLICLRADVSLNRCVVSIPQETDQVYINGNLISLAAINSEWQMVNRAQIESEYQNGDLTADDAVIDFTGEGE